MAHERNLRMTEELFRQVKEIAPARGFASTSAFIRTAIKNELAADRTNEELRQAEERLSGSLVHISDGLRKQNEWIQMQVSLVDSVARRLLGDNYESVRDRAIATFRAAGMMHPDDKAQ